jgi:hypothetical protein
MAFFAMRGAVIDFSFGVVRFEFWVFPCTHFGEGVLSPVGAILTMLVEE